MSNAALLTSVLISVNGKILSTLSAFANAYFSEASVAHEMVVDTFSSTGNAQGYKTMVTSASFSFNVKIVDFPGFNQDLAILNGLMNTPGTVNITYTIPGQQVASGSPTDIFQNVSLQRQSGSNVSGTGEAFRTFNFIASNRISI